jgi:hypothetical protein
VDAQEVKRGIRQKQDIIKADLLNNALPPFKKKPRQKLPLKTLELLGFHSFKGLMN